MNMLWTQLFFVALTLSTINCQTLEDLIKKVTSNKTHLNNKDNVPFPHRNTNFTMESFFQVVLWFSRGLSGT